MVYKSMSIRKRLTHKFHKQNIVLRLDFSDKKNFDIQKNKVRKIENKKRKERDRYE